MSDRKPGRAPDDTRAGKTRNKTRHRSRLRTDGAEHSVVVGCAIDLETGQWPCPLSSKDLGETLAKEIAVSIRLATEAVASAIPSGMLRGVLGVQFEYRGDRKRFTRAFLPRLTRAVSDFLRSSKATSERKRIEDSLVRLRHVPDAAELKIALSDSRSSPKSRSSVPFPVDQISPAPDAIDPTIGRVTALIDHISQLALGAVPKDPLPTLRDLHETHRELRQILGNVTEAVFNRFEGERFDLETSKTVASLIDEIAKSLGLLFFFTAADGVERGARLRCQATGRDRQPTFQFQSTDDEGVRSIHAASRSLPRLTVGLANPRPRAAMQGT